MIFLDKTNGNLIYKVRDLDEEKAIFMDDIKDGEFVKHYKDLIKID